MSSAHHIKGSKGGGGGAGNFKRKKVIISALLRGAFITSNPQVAPTHKQVVS
jgi:hypothetical protein